MVLLLSGLGTIIPERAGTISQKSRDTDETHNGRRVILIKIRGLFYKVTTVKGGIGCFCPPDPQSTAMIKYSLLNEPAHNATPRIRDLRL
jgi:hypothetical protein